MSLPKDLEVNMMKKMTPADTSAEVPVPKAVEKSAVIEALAPDPASMPMENDAGAPVSTADGDGAGAPTEASTSSAMENSAETLAATAVEKAVDHEASAPDPALMADGDGAEASTEASTSSIVENKAKLLAASAVKEKAKLLATPAIFAAIEKFYNATASFSTVGGDGAEASSGAPASTIAEKDIYQEAPAVLAAIKKFYNTGAAASAPSPLAVETEATTAASRANEQEADTPASSTASSGANGPILVIVPKEDASDSEEESGDESFGNAEYSINGPGPTGVHSPTIEQVQQYFPFIGMLQEQGAAPSYVAGAHATEALAAAAAASDNASAVNGENEDPAPAYATHPGPQAIDVAEDEIPTVPNHPLPLNHPLPHLEYRRYVAGVLNEHRRWVDVLKLRDQMEQRLRPLRLTTVLNVAIRHHDPNAAGIEDLPGTDIYEHTGTRAVDGSLFKENHVLIVVSGTAFCIPRSLLEESSEWTTRLAAPNRPHRFTINHVSAAVFGLLIEVLHSPDGLHGTEKGFNLVKLASSLVLALRWNLHSGARKIGVTIRRYVARRMFAYNPWMSDPTGSLDHNHFVHRSEELYRTWKIANDSPSVATFIGKSQLTNFFVLTVPGLYWPALSVDFDDDFYDAICQTARVIKKPQEEFHAHWALAFIAAGYTSANWQSHVSGLAYGLSTAT